MDNNQNGPDLGNENTNQAPQGNPEQQQQQGYQPPPPPPPGYQQPPYGQPPPVYPQPPMPGYNQKSKMAAGLLGIFLGVWGVHNFYLGFTNRAVLQLILGFVTCGLSSIWGLVEGIMILTGNINADANGVPLRD